ncbi:uncharacterized protein C5orf49 homolog [Pomacea canaliculata]|uniref:uncharacterized protein C5orf49 homolog n=1 Tax=Pomacea canaliculata TaxID=400727 RepID=UPI000D73A7C6|nr:uncharacterized protein C5orf49 homolog [Pomacea canaliculata]
MDESRQTLYVKTVGGDYTLRGRPWEISAFSFVPTERNEPPERTVFNSSKKEQKANDTYNRLFRNQEGYNNKLHRDDREHAKLRGLCVNDEEKVKPVPTLASSVYGHQKNISDPPDRKHVRIGYVKAEFYRRNGIP